MGEELGYPLKDSITSKTRTLSLLNSIKIKLEIKKFSESMTVTEILNKITQAFESQLPTQRKIAHRILNAIFYHESDIIIAICYNDYILSYNLQSDITAEAKMPKQIFSLKESLEEDKFFALGSNEFFLISTNSLKILKIFPFINIKTCFAYSETEIIVATPSEAYIFNLTTSTKKKIDIETSENSAMAFYDILVVSDCSSIRTYSKSFKSLSFIQLKNIKTVKFSENYTQILCISNQEIYILSFELVVSNIIYANTVVTDAIFYEKFQILCCCTIRGEV